MSDYYFANARLYEKNGEILCMYVLTEDCLSVFPIDGLYNIENNVDKIFIKFFNFSKKTMIEDEYDYKEFINCVKDKCDLYDDNNIIIRLSLDQIYEIINKIPKIII